MNTMHKYKGRCVLQAVDGVILYSTQEKAYIQRVAFDADFWNKRQELTSYYFNNFIKYAIEEASTNNNSEVNENTSNE